MTEAISREEAMRVISTLPNDIFGQGYRDGFSCAKEEAMEAIAALPTIPVSGAAPVTKPDYRGCRVCGHSVGTDANGLCLSDECLGAACACVFPEPATTTPADALREMLDLYLPNGYRDALVSKKVSDLMQWRPLKTPTAGQVRHWLSVLE